MFYKRINTVGSLDLSYTTKVALFALAVDSVRHRFSRWRDLTMPT